METRFVRLPTSTDCLRTSMVFDRAYCQGLACYPSRPSMMRASIQVPKRNRSPWGTLTEIRYAHLRVGKIFHMGVPNSPRNGDSGLDVPACWTEFHNTKSPKLIPLVFTGK